MTNNIKVTVELCPEDRERLDKILNALTNSSQLAGEQPNAKGQATEQAQPEQPAQAHTAPQAEQDAAPWDEEPPTQNEPTVTLEDIQHLVVTLATVKGKTVEAREIVKDYADRVTDIPADKWDVVYRRLKALEG